MTPRQPDKYTGPDRRDNSLTGGWHVDKTVSVSHLLTTVAMLVAGLWFIAQQNERIALNAQAISQNKAQIEAQDNRVSRNLDMINGKLDKLHELLIRRSQQ
jgi:hypothetical protein